MKDWDDILAEKKNVHTPRKAWRELEPDLDEMEMVATVWKTKSGQIHMRTSQMDSLDAIGLLSVAKQMYLDEMRD